jgi:hypothetical protein
VHDDDDGHRYYHFLDILIFGKVCTDKINTIPGLKQDTACVETVLRVYCFLAVKCARLCWHQEFSNHYEKNEVVYQLRAADQF